MDFKLVVISMLAVLVVDDVTLASAAVGGNSGWNASPDTQYHIQTDEGDERYFRYQTTSGQYRKEKRLEDGTVVGTSGWVDPNGMLRLQDYIADNQGYRILRSKMVFVGLQPDEGGAKGAKGYKGYKGYAPKQAFKGVESSTANPFYSQGSAGGSVTPLAVYAATTPATPSFSVPAGSNAFYGSGSPGVSVTPLSAYAATTPASPSLSGPGTFDTSYRYPKPEASLNAIGVLYPDQIEALRPNEYESQANSAPLRAYQQPNNNPTIQQYQQPAQEVVPYQYRAPVGNYRDFGQKTRYVNNYDHPIRSKYESFGNSLGGPEGFGSKQQVPTYDGISTTKDGFRYYLPRQYHEEVSSPSGQTRTGSFGYIDPFGIRRVTYYNTNPGSGFIHRKNNRYVGFNATPYDPRF